jgi:hypothetical protein
VVLPLVALAIFMGVASPVFTRKIEPSVAMLVEQVKARTQGEIAVASAPASSPTESEGGAP